MTREADTRDPDLLAGYVHAAVFGVRTTTINVFPEVASCIESTRLLLNVLARLDLPARPQATQVKAHNQIARDALQRGVTLAQWPRSAALLASADIPKPGGWGGHLVAVLRTPTGRLLLDPTADQFDRPGRLEVPGPISLVLPPTWTPDDPAVHSPDGNSKVEYTPMAPGHPQFTLWRETPAWTAHAPWYETVSTDLADMINTGWTWTHGHTELEARVPEWATALTTR